MVSSAFAKSYGGTSVMNSGPREGALFLDDAARRRFLGAVAELPQRQRFVAKLSRQMSTMDMRPHCLSQRVPKL